jgi:hypothetical protein
LFSLPTVSATDCKRLCFLDGYGGLTVAESFSDRMVCERIAAIGKSAKITIEKVTHTSQTVL